MSAPCPARPSTRRRVVPRPGKLKTSVLISSTFQPSRGSPLPLRLLHGHVQMQRILTPKTIFATIAAALFLLVKTVTIAGTIVGLLVNWLGVGLTGTLVLAGI